MECETQKKQEVLLRKKLFNKGGGQMDHNDGFLIGINRTMAHIGNLQITHIDKETIWTKQSEVNPNPSKNNKINQNARVLAY